MLTWWWLVDISNSLITIFSNRLVLADEQIVSYLISPLHAKLNAKNWWLNKFHICFGHLFFVLFLQVVSNIHIRLLLLLILQYRHKSLVDTNTNIQIPNLVSNIDWTVFWSTCVPQIPFSAGVSEKNMLSNYGFYGPLDNNSSN